MVNFVVVPSESPSVFVTFVLITVEDAMICVDDSGTKLVICECICGVLVDIVGIVSVLLSQSQSQGKLAFCIQYDPSGQTCTSPAAISFPSFNTH